MFGNMAVVEGDLDKEDGDDGTIEDIISKVHSGIENNEIKLKIEMPELKSRYLLSAYP